MTSAGYGSLGKFGRMARLVAGALLVALALGLAFAAGPAGASTSTDPCPSGDCGGGGGDGNAAPTVSVSATSYTVNEGGSVTLSGTYNDADGNTVTVTVDANNDGTYESEATGDGASSGTWSYTFSAGERDGPGSQTVKVKAADTAGASNTAPTTVNVLNVAPTASGINAPYSVNEGSGFSISLSGVYEPSYADRNDLRYGFDCGPNLGGYALFIVNQRTCNTTTDSGTYTVKGHVKDKDGAVSADYVKDVLVRNVAPTATANAPESATTGTSFTVSLTDPRDPSSVDAAAGFTYAFDCTNDGTFEHSGTSNSASCTAGNGPSQTVSYRITDKDGGSSVHQKTVTILPLLRVSDVRVSERSKNAYFTVRLSAASQQTITVNYTTANGSAKAPADYATRRSTLTFLPGQTVQRIAVPIRNDRRDERTEYFSVRLYGAASATIADSSGRGTIVDND